MTFFAIGTHWQNGISEWFIGTITQRAWTILLHAMACWPAIITEDLWPFAIQHAMTFYNTSIRRDKNTSPYKLFTGDLPPWTLNDFCVFGYSTYILHKRLQVGDSFQKWRARCWQGMYVRHSMYHASNIPLIYHPASTPVTPQFHIVFDEHFISITNTSNLRKDEFLENICNSAIWIHQ